MKILIAGGAGFIGSTIANRLADDGHQAVVLDNLVTGRAEFTTGHAFYQGDIADGDLVDTIFADHPDISAVVHCAALIVVPDSVAAPLSYYEANVSKSVAFLQHLLRNGATRLLFSSSASIYRSGEDHTVTEDSALEPLSPYARTKAMFEQILADTAAATPLGVISLRYFNPIGCDPELRTGLQIRRPTHALGKLIDCHANGETFQVTGTDWPTRDGSGIRDYIHVADLADAHLKALQNFDTAVGADRYQVINLGTGTGTTVRELVTAFGNVLGRPVDTVDAPARPGDAAGAYTRSTRALDLLGWKAERTIEDGIRDSLAWADIRDTVLQD